MSVETTRAVMMQYVNSVAGDVTLMADDVVFTIMATGQEHRGREAAQGMLMYLFQVAFQATREITNCIIADGHAVVEGYLVGKHVGEFAGIPATHKQVRAPLAIIFELENDQIKRGRVYLEMTCLTFSTVAR